MSNEETLDASEAAYLRKYVAELEAELARLRPLAELYPLAWEECEAHRTSCERFAGTSRKAAKGSWVRFDAHDQPETVPEADAHDKARAERGVGQ